MCLFLTTIGGEIPKRLNRMATTDDFYFDAVSQIHMDNWSSRQIVLLGYAAYCASPMSGQEPALLL